MSERGKEASPTPCIHFALSCDIVQYNACYIDNYYYWTLLEIPDTLSGCMPINGQ